MRIIFFISILITFLYPFYAQSTETNQTVISKLDSISHSESISRYFAAIYLVTTKKAAVHFSDYSERSKSLIARLELKFANLFFEAAQAKQKGSTIPTEWQSYYSDNSLQPLQYLLLGINIHINENIWEALIEEFTSSEFEEFKPIYFEYYNLLKKIYSEVYQMAWSENNKIKRLHSFSFGLDEVYGKIMLKRWRRRQFRLAELYFADPVSFQTNYAVLQKKVVATNNLIKRIL